MAHKKKSTCPNPYTVFRSLKKEGRLPEKANYDEWKARLMVKAGRKKSTFMRLVRVEATGLPHKTLKETYARKLRMIAKDIRKDMRKRFKVDRDIARGAVTDILRSLAYEDINDEDDSTIVSQATTSSSTIHVGEGHTKYIPSPKSIFDTLKKDDEIDPKTKYDEWKAYYVVKAGGPKKTRALRRIMADLANELNDGQGVSIIRSVYVHRLRRAMREIAKDIVSCKNKTRAEAKGKVQDLLRSMADYHDDDISTVVSAANRSAVHFAPKVNVMPSARNFGPPRPAPLTTVASLSSPSGASTISGLTNATGLETAATAKSRWFKVAGAVGGVVKGANKALGDFTNKFGGVDDDDNDVILPPATPPLYKEKSAYHSSYFNDYSPPMFYPRNQSRVRSHRRW